MTATLPKSESLRIRFGLASPAQIRQWSYGKVTTERVLDRSGKFAEGGLFCERIFGSAEFPWRCENCGKDQARSFSFWHLRCQHCDQVLRNVRHRRMGHIELAIPIAHVWFLRSSAGLLAKLIGVNRKKLQRVADFEDYLVLKVSTESSVCPGEIVTQKRARQLSDKHGKAVVCQTGAAAIDQWLRQLDLDSLVVRRQREIKEITASSRSLSAGLGRTRPAADKKLVSVLKPYLDATRNPRWLVRAAKSIVKSLREDDLAQSQRRSLISEQWQQVCQRRVLECSEQCRIASAFLIANQRPEWAVLKYLPVIPPDLRPVTQSWTRRVSAESEGGGRQSDETTLSVGSINYLYQRVLRINKALREAQQNNWPDSILQIRSRELQHAVDALLDNGLAQPSILDRSGAKMVSLIDRLKGKTGLFRRSLLGKVVDYSGRAVIVPQPRLALHQCGLPRGMARELFKSHLIPHLVSLIRENTTQLKQPEQLARMLMFGDQRVGQSILRAHARRQTVGSQPDLIDEALERTIRCGFVGESTRPVVLLNRQPSLHRMNVQAFEPVLCDGDAIQLHPLACESFGADFDGDTMAVHLPLSTDAQQEARSLMLSPQNVLSPADGRLIYGPSQDVVLGCYWLTAEIGDPQLRGVYSSFDELRVAFENRVVKVHDWVIVRTQRPSSWGERLPRPRRVQTTVGRVLFNCELPEQVPFQNGEMTKKSLRDLFVEVFDHLGRDEMVASLDRIKTLGFQMATQSGQSIAVSDLVATTEFRKSQLLENAARTIAKETEKFAAAKISSEELYARTLQIHAAAADQLNESIAAELERNSLNPVGQMLRSEARGSRIQIQHLMAMRGVMSRADGSVADRRVKLKTGPKGRATIREPYCIPTNLKGGLPQLDYFFSSHGMYASLATTKLLTGDWGYLTRRLMYLAQDVMVTQFDCGAKKGISGPVDERMLGRVASREVQRRGEQILSRNELITFDKIHTLQRIKGLASVQFRSPLSCQAPKGVCQLCYGMELSSRKLVPLGSAVGVLAVQSVCEPGTQLNLKMKHTGGSTIKSHPRQILNDISAYFEAYRTQQGAVLAPVSGRVSLRTAKQGGKSLTITPRSGCPVRLQLAPEQDLCVKNGHAVRIGDPLTKGVARVDELLQLCDVITVGRRVVAEIHNIYSEGDASINEKHIELIVAKMLKWGQVVEPGQSGLPADALLEQCLLQLVDGKQNPRLRWKPAVRGATRTARRSHSVLASAAFQNAHSILEAAFLGQLDPLLGPVENVVLSLPLPTDPGRSADWNYGGEEVCRLPLPKGEASSS